MDLRALDWVVIVSGFCEELGRKTSIDLEGLVVVENV